ncbi:T9SS type A sorting domain-containing protein [Hymenobacter terricola]|uniref:T9SS type A sorting domain-containing protein n=1 Tax=Hymenobacter terricola TaxID=2819236 RepID=UPI001B30959D|nr:T9SS type A sorting domain-containing protein [Hymenobacter terricola]
MKQRLPFVLFILLILSLLGGLQAACATHLLGGDMTYLSLGNNQYRVKFRLYRDCTGITPSGFILSCNTNGCNGTATVTALFVQQGGVEAGNPFCAAVSSGPCLGPTGLPNYDVYNYLATVTLPPGQWTLSTDQGARPSLANIVAGNLYVQATLDNRNSATGAAVANNSPQFDVQDIPIQYVCWRQPTTITYSATEADGDSLVYSLTAPLEACGTPVTYNANNGLTVGDVVLSSSPLCLFRPPSLPGNFTPTMPIPVSLDTLGNCPIKTGIPRFVFNQQARTISLTPSVYVPNSPTNLGLNKYQIAVLITEYRRINGVRRVIGTVRREANLIVTDCGGNTVPNPVTATPQTPNANTLTVNNIDTTQLSVVSCSYSRVRLSFTDPDNLRLPSAHQLLTVTLPTDINTNPNLLDSGDIGSFTLAGNGTENPVGTFFFQPSASTVGRTIRLNIRVEDNACPIKGVQNRVVLIKIRRGNFAVALATTGGGASPAICTGSGSLTIRGSVLRPDSVRRFAQNTTLLQTYAYQWMLVSGNGFNTATATQQNITVTPTVTSRYRLQINPISGFGPGCGDTTSIVVRVLPPVATPTVTRNGNTLISSATTGNQWFRDGQAIAGATGQTFTPTLNGAYTVTVAAAGSAGCTSAPSAPLAALATQHALPGTSLSVVPNPTPNGRFSVILTGYSQPVELTVLDALGRTVAHASVATPNPQSTSHALDLTSLSTGLYVLQVRTANSLETRRVVRE